jgi:hypothetical protein
MTSNIPLKSYPFKVSQRRIFDKKMIHSTLAIVRWSVEMRFNGLIALTKINKKNQKHMSQCMNEDKRINQ